MNKETESKLEELIHRELSKLPQRQAPEDLVPRVLSAIQARSRKKWWQRPWTSWPLGCQIASLPFLLLGVGGLVFGLKWLTTAQPALQMEPSPGRIMSLVQPILDEAALLGGGLLSLLMDLGPTWLVALTIVTSLMYVFCIGVGTVCFRMACPRR